MFADCVHFNNTSLVLVCMSVPVASCFTSCSRTVSILSILLLFFVSFEVFMAVTMKNGGFWGITRCGSCKNRS
jgi:Na+-driven multidrug efflux pump